MDGVVEKAYPFSMRGSDQYALADPDGDDLILLASEFKILQFKDEYGISIREELKNRGGNLWLELLIYTIHCSNLFSVRTVAD